MSIATSVVLFSPVFQGSNEAWNWICKRSNERACKAPILNEAQIQYGLTVGYLTNSEVDEIRKLRDE